MPEMPPDIHLNHRLFECLIDLEQEIGSALVIIETQFILSSPFEDSKQ
jgi:hypothetical protein